MSASVAVFIEIKTIIKTNVKEDSIEVTIHCRMFRASEKRLQIGARVKSCNSSVAAEVVTKIETATAFSAVRFPTSEVGF